MEAVICDRILGLVIHVAVPVELASSSVGSSAALLMRWSLVRPQPGQPNQCGSSSDGLERLPVT